MAKKRMHPAKQEIHDYLYKTVRGCNAVTVRDTQTFCSEMIRVLPYLPDVCFDIIKPVVAFNDYTPVLSWTLPKHGMFVGGDAMPTLSALSGRRVMLDFALNETFKWKQYDMYLEEDRKSLENDLLVAIYKEL